MPRAVLAIDQGTTGTTALVIAHDGSCLLYTSDAADECVNV